MVQLQWCDDAAMTDETRGAESSSAGSTLGSLALELCLGKEKAGASKVFEKFLITESTEISLPCKISLATQLEHQKLPQLERDQCLPTAVCGGRGVQRVTPRTKSTLWRVCILEAAVQSRC
jgi:hypothetical protein